MEYTAALTVDEGRALCHQRTCHLTCRWVILSKVLQNSGCWSWWMEQGVRAWWAADPHSAPVDPDRAVRTLERKSPCYLFQCDDVVLRCLTEGSWFCVRFNSNGLDCKPYRLDKSGLQGPEYANLSRLKCGYCWDWHHHHQQVNYQDHQVEGYLGYQVWCKSQKDITNRGMHDQRSQGKVGDRQSDKPLWEERHIQEHLQCNIGQWVLSWRWVCGEGECFSGHVQWRGVHGTLRWWWYSKFERLEPRLDW